MKAAEPTRYPDTSARKRTASTPRSDLWGGGANVSGVASTVLFCSDTFWDDRGDEIVAIDPTVEVVRLVGHEHVIPSDLERITAAFFSPDTWPDRAANFMGTCVRAPNLTWLQTFSAGTDSPIFKSFRDRGVTITNSSGASSASIAQTVMLYLLALARDLPGSRVNRPIDAGNHVLRPTSPTCGWGSSDSGRSARRWLVWRMPSGCTRSGCDER